MPRDLRKGKSDQRIWFRRVAIRPYFSSELVGLQFRFWTFWGCECADNISVVFDEKHYFALKAMVN